MNTFLNSIETLLGLGVDAKDLGFVQISLRGIIVLMGALVMIRLGSKRWLAEKTAFDVVIIVILASMLSRAVNGSSPFFPTLGCGFVLVFLHRMLASIAYRSHAFGILIKGQPHVIVRDGEMDPYAMRRNQVSKHDLEEDMRLSIHTDDLSRVRVAQVERSGDISFIKTSD